MITCEMCDVVTSTYTVWLDVEDNTQHFTCGDFDCDCAFDGDNSMECVEVVE